MGQAVQPFKAVETEEVALALDQVRGAARGGHQVEPGKPGE
jgi:hypothetical protein